ncbi:ARF-binding protein, partial [Cryomyces antarcticus]
DVIYIKSNVSNNSAQPVSEFTLQLAVTKGYTLKLEPQSGRTLAAQAGNAITQTIRLNGVERGKGNAVKMRWRASYVLDAEKREEQGEIQSLGVA